MMAGESEHDGGRMSLWQALRASCGTRKDRQNQYRFVAWMAAWGVSFVGGIWLLENLAGMHRALVWSIALLPNLFAIAALFAYLRFLREADELVRRIQLEGLAVGFGVGAIYAMGYFLFERIGAPILGADDIVFAMMMGWVFGQFVGTWRYR